MPEGQPAEKDRTRKLRSQTFKLHQHPEKRHGGATASVASLFKYDDRAWTEQVRERELRRRKGSEGVPREPVYVDESYDQESSEYNILRTAKDEEEDLERRQASTYQHTIGRSAERRQHEEDLLEEQRR